jgi:hypothetical protein
MKKAFQSVVGEQCAADRKILADNEEVQLYLYDSKDVYFPGMTNVTHRMGS